MAEFVEYFNNESLELVAVESRDKKSLTIVDARGRTNKLNPDKVLFSHRAESLNDLIKQLEDLQSQVDVKLLWESLHSEEELEPKDAKVLAQIYFDEQTTLFSSAIFRALINEKLHFRRKGIMFEPRTMQQVQQVCVQREAEQRTAKEIEEITIALEKQKISSELAVRLEQYIRGGQDRILGIALEKLWKDPQRQAFSLLVREGYISKSTDFEVIKANLVTTYPQTVLDYAEQLSLPNEQSDCKISEFSIDDPDTQEVDDALSVSKEENLFRIDIDIADVAAVVDIGDPIDKEALCRSTSVYLPTQTYYMLPSLVSCNYGSLLQGQPRQGFRTSVWLDQDATIVKFELRRTQIKIQRRLNYEEVDHLLQNGQEQISVSLRLLFTIAEKLNSKRCQNGAFFVSRPEWKIRVSPVDGRISIKQIDRNSKSRLLVSEMMILANSLAAGFAKDCGIPIIYRVQSPPLAPLPQVDLQSPGAFVKFRGLISPASLSLIPDKHWALGLAAYTQVTSPLRRYGDLVMQRQIGAYLEGKSYPYDVQDLMKILAAVDSTEQEMKRLEAAVSQRWALEYVFSKQNYVDKISAVVVGEVTGGYRLQLLNCGAVGIVNTREKHEIGDLVDVSIEQVIPSRDVLRLRS